MRWSESEILVYLSDLVYQVTHKLHFVVNAEFKKMENMEFVIEMKIGKMDKK